MAYSVVITIGVGLLLSVAAGRASVHLIERLPEERQRAAQWAVVLGAACVAVVGVPLSNGLVAQQVFALVVATLPGLVAYLAWRTAVASAILSTPPLYFAIADLVRTRTLHVPVTALDGLVPVEPAWVVIYWSLGAFVLLPLLVVREPRLFRRALQSYLFVIAVAYAGFLLYPTVMERPAAVPGSGFTAWCLRLTYSLDTRFNCFPSLHVAHSFVAALACYRVHRGVGIAAAVWASLVGVSTLYTKQHYAADAIAGASIAFVAYLLFLRGYRREDVPEDVRRLAPRRALAVVAIFGLCIALVWSFYRSGTVVV